jgi:glycosyl-4,4'-diaponeurosporenoate acyltransferase
MGLVDLPIPVIILIDSLAWGIIQPTVGYLSMKFPDSWLDYRHWLYRERAWERSGQFYDDIFRVRRWKGKLPYGGALFQQEFSMRRFTSKKHAYIEGWIRESCRAELCHWVAITPALFFYLWNPMWLWLVMILYAICFNLIPIIVQRYNRPRLLRMMKNIRNQPRG